MKKFDSLEDIRKQIDKIDLRILDLISERKELGNRSCQTQKKRSDCR